MRMEAKKIILSRLLPKTGQITSDWAGDDGTYQAGWWRGKTVADNLLRFIPKTINTDNLVIDRATGLMWPKEVDSYGGNNDEPLNWVSAINYCLTLNFGGFTDWRLPNINELLSIVSYKQPTPTVWPPFVFATGGLYWSSTSYYLDMSDKWCVDFVDGGTERNDLAYANRFLAVRGAI